jgi:Zn-dependent protease with chaperone function
MFAQLFLLILVLSLIGSVMDQVAWFPFAETLFTLLGLTLYFFMRTICHRFLSNRSNAWSTTRFLIPFTFPFLLFIVVNDTAQVLHLNDFLASWGIMAGSFLEALLFFLLSMAIIIAALICFPPLAIFTWRCSPLEDSTLKQDLDALCIKARFKHAGFKIWSLMPHLMSAAILGIVGKFRYVLFTPKLLNRLPSQSIVAILAHEIGHAKHRHLLFYPMILLGMILVGSLVPTLLYESLFHDITFENEYPILTFILLFSSFAATMALYFRLVFGYFSRLFERQADLHVLELGIPAADMIHALDVLGMEAGHIHDEPNWHHHSIRDRMLSLEEANGNRSLIARHAKRVRLSLLVYFFILLSAMIAFWIRVS